MVQFCEVLQSPPNGLVVQTGTIETSVATYTCDLGYIRDGTMTRTCQRNAATIPGVWSGSEPVCNSECIPSLQHTLCASPTTSPFFPLHLTSIHNHDHFATSKVLQVQKLRAHSNCDISAHSLINMFAYKIIMYVVSLTSQLAQNRV